MATAENRGDQEEEDLEAVFIEQAEYISEDKFTIWNVEHPEEDSIIRRLSLGGAKLLVGPRGCGKTTLMLKAYYSLISAASSKSLPIYVNFKSSLRLEPLYINTPNATYWFKKWLVLKIFEALHVSLAELQELDLIEEIPSRKQINNSLRALEAASTSFEWDRPEFETQYLVELLEEIVESTGRNRCVLLLDDAAHAFSPKQQEDFFELFRKVKTRIISPKAAIYPGITTLSASFHVGHDAEQIDVWIRPDSPAYHDFMRTLAFNRFAERLPRALRNDPEALRFLSLAAFGIPRSFLNMLRRIYQADPSSLSSGNTVDRRLLLDAAKNSREAAHGVYDSLTYKLPAYKTFVATGNEIYSKIIENLKEFNKIRSESDQACEVGISKPVAAEMSKVLSFFQYAGILMPIGENSRGVKGVFELYMVHFGDLITENAIIGKRSKSISSFIAALSAQTHQVWPRISPDRLVRRDNYSLAFPLSLPNCQNCNSPRASEHARFCDNCGAQLKTASLYDQLINQDISVLPITKIRASRIRQHSKIRTIKDILIDTSRTELRSVPNVGKIWAERIARYAEEHVA